MNTLNGFEAALRSESIVRPFVTVFATVSLDGKLASRLGYSKLSCPLDKKRQFWLRSQVDGVIVGVNTVIVDDPTLRPKLFERKREGRYYRIVLDGRLRIPLSARILDTTEFGTIVITKTRDSWKISELRNRGVEVVIAKDLGDALKQLFEVYGLKRVMVEGGGNTIWSFIRSRLIDEIRLTITSIVFGGSKAVTLVDGDGFLGLEAPKLELKFVGVCKCLKEVHLVYEFPNPRGIPAESGPGIYGDFVYELHLR